jgi:hypothetical protein
MTQDFLNLDLPNSIPFVANFLPPKALNDRDI